MYLLLLARLKSRDPETRRGAVAEVGRVPNLRAFRLLEAMLGDADAEVRRLAVDGLSRIETEGRLEVLLRALQDPDPRVIQAAVLGIKRCHQAEPAPHLEPLLKHDHAGVRGQAALTLEAFGWQPSNVEDEIWFWVAKRQFSRLPRFGAASIPVLEAVLSMSPSNASAGLVEALGQIEDPRVLRPLMQTLNSEDPSVCVVAIEALGRLGGKEVVAPILAMTHHANAHVRAQAVEALGRLRATEAAEAICALLEDSVWEVRRQAAEGLGRLGDRASMAPLARALSDPDPDVREAAAAALGNLGGPEALPPLVLALGDAATEVRRQATAALKRIDPEWHQTSEAFAALAQLEAGLDDAELAAQYYVRQLLAGIGPRSALSSSTLPDPLASPAAKRRHLAVTLFQGLLGDPDRDLRQTAAEALGRLADPHARPALLRGCNDPDRGVREAVEEALLALDAAPRLASASA